ncbi:glycosyltransferase [Bordetella sp. BOR01]|uniref:glycosyltransferase n=1 Tax=Bordetella sp. BOR01 TaxID=2854779 RepID=UPI001C44C791|nr:glycosyltransferase [Bordetella sp. BOR01]MBV7485437.1 glycosyltransferase [Bordetella sp. BOR01]
MIIFVRSYIADLDARLAKYFKALDAASLPFRFIGWNKTGAVAKTSDPRVDYFERRARLGAGWANAAALMLWNLYILRHLLRHRAQVRVVHAVDLDCALACWLFCAIFRRSLVFDIYDKYTAVRNIGGLLGRTLDALERRVAFAAPLTLLASQDRLAQHGIPAGRANVLVLENVPYASMPEPVPGDARPPWKLGYFGVLEARHRGLEDLLAVCAERADVELHVAGYGALQDDFSAAARQCANVFFHGPLPSDQGLALMARTDVIVGCYYPSVANHAYASPNKYYEHLLLGRAMVTTRGTPPGRRVVEHGTGWALEPGAAALRQWLDTLTSQAVRQAGERAYALWQQRYAAYFQTHYCGAYVARIRALLNQEGADVA